MRPWNFSPETWKSDWETTFSKLRGGRLTWKSCLIGRCCHPAPEMCPADRQAVRLLKIWVCECFIPLFQLSMGGPAGQTRGEGRPELGGLLSWSSQDLCLPFDLLLTSWVEASLLHQEGDVQDPCLSCRQFSTTLSLLHAEVEAMGICCQEAGKGREIWMVGNHTERCSVHCSWLSQSWEPAAAWAFQDTGTAGWEWEQYGLGGRSHCMELTRGDLGCLCPLAGHALKCHPYLLLKITRS